MLGPPEGIAHVSYDGGSLCMPARSPYDRELLAEMVLREALAHDTVQLLFDHDRWLVRRLEWPRRVRCRRCRQPTGCACYSGRRQEAAHCIECALGKPLLKTRLHRVLRAA